MPALQGSRAISGSVTPTTNDDGWSLRVTANATVTLTNSGWTVGRSGMFFPVVGAATVTFQAGASVTVRNVAGDLVQNRQYDGATALYTGTNEWTIYGSEDEVPDGAVTTAKLADGAVTLAKQANLATDRIIGRVSSGTGVPEALTPAQVREVAESARATLLDIRDYGAVGNGSTDNTTAIQNAIDESHDRLGAVVLIPEGDFVADQLTMRDHVILRGLGWGGTAPLTTVPTLGTSVLRQGSGVNDDFIVWEETDYGVDYAGASALQHLIIIGDASSTGGHAIHLKDGSLNLRLQDGVEIEKLFIRGFFGDAFRAYGCTPGFISGLRVFSVGGYAINMIEDGANTLGDVHHLVVRDLSADACEGGAAIRVEGARPMAAHTFIGIKSEQADRVNGGDGTSGYGSEHVFEFHNCQHRVDITGVTHISAAAMAFRPDSVVKITGDYRPEIAWSGVNVRLVSTQTTGDLPHMIDDEVEGITVPMSRGAQGTLHRGQRRVEKITGRPPAVRLLDRTGASAPSMSTPNTTALQIVGDLDIRARILPGTKSGGEYAIVTKRLGATGEWSLRMNFDRTLTLARYGASGDFRQSTAAVSFGSDPLWVRVTHDVSVNGGASPREAKFFTSTDGVTWTQLGSTVVVAGEFIATATTNPVIIGNEDDLRRFVGRIYEVEVRDGIDGAVVLRFDANDVPECPWGQSTWVGSVDGLTYTATGVAEVEPSSFLPVSAGGTGADTPAGARAALFPDALEVTGARDDGSALADLLAKLETLGVIVDSSTAS